jgi:hypothetical protein
MQRMKLLFNEKYIFRNCIIDDDKRGMSAWGNVGGTITPRQTEAEP